MESLLALTACVGRLACGEGSTGSVDKPPAHAPVTGPAMYTIRVPARPG